MENKYMRRALTLAEECQSIGEVPVGAVIVRNGEIIAEGTNRRETDKTALGHAEIEAIQNACRALGGWRLDDCDLYVTLEPCPMCAGAIINARIKTVYFGAYDSKAGSFGSVEDFSRFKYPYTPEIIGGVMEKECEKILTEFFRKLR
ncbi:MAG: nucleoside deaminase [Ruminococcaceae bacterium]|nr:nucleoside deaminase [Oscillospiraceae bacterium]